MSRRRAAAAAPPLLLRSPLCGSQSAPVSLKPAVVQQQARCLSGQRPGNRGKQPPSWTPARPAPRLDGQNSPQILWADDSRFSPRIEEFNAALAQHNPHTLLRPTPDEVQRGKMLFKRGRSGRTGTTVAHTGVELVCAAHADALEELPDPDALHCPEVAFAGRSNVGKSSLLGRLLRSDASFVKASATPGKTQSVNMYAFLPHRNFALVDLPGYGYARASREESLRWRRNIARYLTSRDTALRRVFVLVDARVGLKKVDHAFMRSLEEDSDLPYQLVLTKVDKLAKARLQKQLEAIVADAHVESEERGPRRQLHPRVVVSSAVSGVGLDEIQAHIAEAVLEQ
jgi:GTP-binding protein